ncbi:hypothetical protein B0H14DRAFT_3437478 [Mycena olivaceomarginata]|nr:hypothetical protein B0H14DRAFT_3437478 [Mycena olivaceomarginata]
MMVQERAQNGGGDDADEDPSRTSELVPLLVQMTSHRNPLKAVIPRKRRSRVVGAKRTADEEAARVNARATAKKRRETRLKNMEGLAADLDTLHQESEERAQELAAKYDQAQGQPLQREDSVLMARLNKDRDIGCRYTMPDIKQMVKDDPSMLEGFSKEEEGSMVNNIQEKRDKKHHGARANNLAASADAKRTVERLMEEITGLAERSGMIWFAMFTRGHIHDTSIPVTLESWGALSFFREVLKRDPADIAALFELWGEIRGWKRCSPCRRSGMEMIETGLQTIAGRTKIAMNYDNYIKAIVEGKNFGLLGWPRDVDFKRMSKQWDALTLQPPRLAGARILPGAPNCSSYLVSLHRLRLESSLDSALAALALIHDTVLRALCRHATLLACPAATTPAPKRPTPPKNTDAATYAKAAKAAGAAADHTTAPKVDVVPKVPKPHANEAQYPPPPSLSPSPSPSPLKAQSPHRSPSPPQAPPQHKPSCPCPHVVFRFDDGISEPPAGRLAPAMLLDALKKTVLAGQMDFDRAITTGEAWDRLPAMWGAIRQTLKYPKSTPCPRADTGGPWPSVIVHNVPVPTAASSTESAAEDWLRQGGYEGTVQRIIPLCSKETLSTKCTVPYRVSLISMAEAEFLVEHGALLFGSRCRVSHYTAKPRFSLKAA